MKNTTRSSARTWGTLLMVIAVSFASVGTAAAQQGAPERSASWRRRESEASDRLARAAAERLQAEQAAQNEAIERGLAEQAQQQRVLEQEAWARALDQASEAQQERGRPHEAKRYAGQAGWAARVELSRHAHRKAYLARLFEVAIEEPLILGRVEALFEREQRRHQFALGELGVLGR